MKIYPLVSIFMTCYNHENFIEETVLSVLQQSYKNIQLVVSDDGSLDSTPLILKQLSKKYPKKLEIHLHKENRGSTWNYNFSYQQCRGNYICYLDGDDIMLQGKISAQLSFMMENPDYILSYHNIEVFNSNKPNNFYLWNQRFGTKTGTAKHIIKFGNYLPSCSVMFKKSTPKINFDERISYSPDWLFWIDLLVKTDGKIGYINQVLGRYRRHDNNLTLNWGDKIDSQLKVLDIVEKQYSQYSKDVKRRRGEIYFMKAIYLFVGMEYKVAQKTLSKSLNLYFPNFLAIFRLPLREILFFLKSNLKFDDLVNSLFKKN